MTVVLPVRMQHPMSQAEQATSATTASSARSRMAAEAERVQRGLSPVPITTTFWLKNQGDSDGRRRSESQSPGSGRLVSTPALVKAQQQAQSRSSSRTGRRSSLAQSQGAQGAGAAQQQVTCQSPFRRPSSRQSPHPGQPGPATLSCGPGSQSEAICTTSPVQRSTITSILDKGQGQGLHQQGDHGHPPTQIAHVDVGLGLGGGQAQSASQFAQPSSRRPTSPPALNTSSTQPSRSPTVSPATAAAAVPVVRPASARLGHARAQSYGNIDSTLLSFNQQELQVAQSQTHRHNLHQDPHHQDHHQGGIPSSPHDQYQLDFQPQRHFGRPTEAPVNITGRQQEQQSSPRSPSSPPPPQQPPPQPPRRRLQPTASRRQALSHSRSRRLAPRQQQRIDPPVAHRRQSPFLPPPPPSSLAACSDLSSSSLSLPSSPCPSPAPISSPVLFAATPSSSSTTHRHTLSSPSPLSVSSLPHPPHPPQSPPVTMSRSSRNPPPTAANATRQNEYFVPRDGIDREVISADICRYLGNDALVRPGHYENPQTGQVVQGYYITAYRNLTTAMIEDLKADSARWDSERRAQTSHNTSGGIKTSRAASGVPTRHSSNSPVVQYRYSETHQSRQHHGPTEAPYQSDPYSRDGYDGPRYPGTGTPGYTGASGSAYGQQGYASTSSGAYGSYPQTQQSPPPTDSRFGSTPQAGSVLNQAFQPAQDPYMTMGVNRNQRGYTANDPYANPATSAATTGASQPGYPATASYQYSSQVPASGAPSYTMQPQDPFYGRGAYSAGISPISTSTSRTKSDSLASPAGQSAQQGYAAQGQQYEETPRSRASATPTNTQTNPSATSNRRSERDSDRHPSDRHHRSSRR
ncbi:hypothetical protein B0T10DRAFT_573940 [Thelonectria olida]|uniref:Transcription factor n=1 Tax=Thelonectria olida TaxID=1576542 RepID=A0A9P9AND9_9HYPO|nr:hypothetical protein B0T10DRAFT_573940 [Thelonectria olida]